MQKAISTVFLILFSLLGISFVNNSTDKVEIKLSITDSVSPEKISIIVEVKNLSKTTKKILQNSKVDYKTSNITAIGNFIIEFQKLEGEKYIDFPPTADIDPVFNISVYNEVKPQEIYVEKIILNGRSWNSNGFPKGKYRIRVAFNWDERSNSLKQRSEWVTFSVN